MQSKFNHLICFIIFYIFLQSSAFSVWEVIAPEIDCHPDGYMMEAGTFESETGALYKSKNRFE